MTGYGRASITQDNKTYTVEIRALNSKILDLSMKIPSEYRSMEIEYRKIVSNRLLRGKIDVQIQIDNQNESATSEINQALALAYYNQIAMLEETVKRKSVDPLAIIFKLPDVVVQSKKDPSEGDFKLIESLINQALNDLENFRKQEGDALFVEFQSQIKAIGDLLKAIEPFEDERVTTVKEKLRKNLEDKLGELMDNNRLEQEFILYIEKLDVSEEKMRLANHLHYFIETMNDGKEAGKKLGFITQEIGREINTLGSKSNHAEMQKIVVQMKDALEKIKEQILNTL
jgi:uncharacterized protein (TIGR00255 family)